MTETLGAYVTKTEAFFVCRGCGKRIGKVEWVDRHGPYGDYRQRVLVIVTDEMTMNVMAAEISCECGDKAIWRRRIGRKHNNK